VAALLRFLPTLSKSMALIVHGFGRFSPQGFGMGARTNVLGAPQSCPHARQFWFDKLLVEFAATRRLEAAPDAQIAHLAQAFESSWGFL
jgi:hypothetical protein